MKKSNTLIKRNSRLKANPHSINIIGSLFLGLAFLSCNKKDNPSTSPGINQVKHVVVIYLENHSFDNLYGQLSGANGLSNAQTANITQMDATGKAYTFLPAIPGNSAFPGFNKYQQPGEAFKHTRYQI